MTSDEFTEKIFARVTRNYLIDDKDIASIKTSIKRCFEWGFSELDAFRFATYTEEVNPDLSEGRALERMAILCKKYGVEGKKK